MNIYYKSTLLQRAIYTLDTLKVHDVALLVLKIYSFYIQCFEPTKCHEEKSSIMIDLTHSHIQDSYNAVTTILSLSINKY